MIIERAIIERVNCIYKVLFIGPFSLDQASFLSGLNNVVCITQCINYLVYTAMPNIQSDMFGFTKAEVKFQLITKKVLLIKVAHHYLLTILQILNTNSINIVLFRSRFSLNFFLLVIKINVLIANDQQFLYSS